MDKLSRSWFVSSIFWIGCFLSACLQSCANDPTADKRPNIVILLADDLGYGELGCYGQELIKTPNLDQLAASGMRFTNLYSGTSVCSPSRASLLTGQHTGHTNIRGNKGLINDTWDRVPLRQSDVTIGETLQSAGYQTAFIGKWHLGVPEDTSTWAMSRGFDYAVQEQWGVSGQGHTYDERTHWVNSQMDSVQYNFEEWDCLDEFRTSLALDYLEDKEAEEPFLLFMSYRIPHAHEYHIRYNDLYVEHGWPEIERTHAARITMLDEQIGRLIKTLERNGDLDNTLIIFTSDNGPQGENGHNDLFFNSSGGLKGHKRDLYVGGIRVPMFAYWEDKIEAGSSSEHLSAFYDVLPTVAEAAGAQIPLTSDGISFLPTLMGQDQKQHEHLYWEIQTRRSESGFKQAVRKGDWKAVRVGKTQPIQIFNLIDDPIEERNLATYRPDLLEVFNQIFQVESNKNRHWPYSGQ